MSISFYRVRHVSGMHFFFYNHNTRSRHGAPRQFVLSYTVVGNYNHGRVKISHAAPFSALLIPSFVLLPFSEWR